jgi:hypothetical protein
MLKRLLLGLLLVYSLGMNAQDYVPADYQSVLKFGNTDSTFIFDHTIDTKYGKAYDRLELKYLGTFTTQRGNTHKIMTSYYEWGLGQRGTSRILVYNNLNQYVGNYYMYQPYNLPIKMVNGILYFDYSAGYCDCGKNLHPTISFKKGLPKEFFLPCNGTMRDFYQFD